MGPDQRTTSDIEADAFFAAYINAPDDVIARVAAEANTHTGPDLDAIVAESAAFSYWDRTIAARNARRAVKERAEAVKQVAASTRWAHPNEAARLAPLPAESLALLPKRRVVRLTDQERLHTAQYWRWVDGLTSPMLANRLQREAVIYQRHQRWLTTKTAARIWRREQREFEREQLLTARTELVEYRAYMRRQEQEQRQAARAEQERQFDVMLQDRARFAEEHPEVARSLWLQTDRGQREYWQQRKRAARWVAISEERALEIALAVYDARPPQDRNWP